MSGWILSRPLYWVHSSARLQQSVQASVEQVHAAAIREAREEAGLEIRLDELINVYSYPGKAPVIIVYAATMIGGCLACDDEGLEARFFSPDEIPWGELAFQSTQDALKELFGGAKRPRPTSEPRAPTRS